MSPKEERGGGPARLAIGLASLWILTGACFKLFLGTPADLPPIVRNLPADFGLDLGTTFRLAIAIELCIAFVGLMRPRWGWLPVCALFAVFELVLLTLLGDESCGCFGSTVQVTPEVMAGVDGVLLVLLLATRPWKTLGRGGPNVVWIAGAMAVAITLPWLFDRQVPESGIAVSEEGRVSGAWLELDLEGWVGKEIFDTPLADAIPMEEVSFDGLWVFYRYTCDHCAKHLTELAETDTGERLLTLVRLVEPHDNEANRVVFTMPEGGHVLKTELPDSVTYILQTPGELELEGGLIIAGRSAVGAE